MTVLDKAFQTVNLFRSNSRGFTAKELSVELDISLRTAYRYLQAIAICFPITSDAAEPSRYRLMGSKEWKA